MLRGETEKVWQFLSAQTGLGEFVLIGGSALALWLQHRISEDLDLACLSENLPKARLDHLVKVAADSGFLFQGNDNLAALKEFTRGGLDLRDYIVNNQVGDQIRLASLEELFRSKCLIKARRSKTRDWFDLYILFRQHGFTMNAYQQAFVDAGIPSEFELGLTRLCSGVPQANDEGYSHLLPNPPSLPEMRDFFILQRNRFEVEQAASARNQARNV